MIIYLCTPAPLAGVCHYLLIYALIDKNEIGPLLEGNFWLRVWVSQSAKGSIRLGEDRAIGYRTVLPTVEGLPRVKKNSLLLDVIKEKVEEVRED